jgi:hypothetical protein
MDYIAAKESWWVIFCAEFPASMGKYIENHEVVPRILPQDFPIVLIPREFLPLCR